MISIKKYLFTIIAITAITFGSYAQVNTGIGTRNPDPSAALEVNSTSGGVLPPRMTNAQRDAISSPAKGLVIFSIDDDCLQCNIGTPASPNWDCVSNQGSGLTQGVVSISSISPPTPAGALLSEICLGEICIIHDGIATAGNLRFRSNTGATLTGVSIGGFQVATSGVNLGNVTIETLDPATYGPGIFRGGALVGEFIFYQITTDAGGFYRVVLANISNGNYLIVGEQIRVPS